MKEKKLKYIIFEGTNEDWFEKINGDLKGKAQLIYLDPPYNTKRNRGARKGYNDKDYGWKETIENILKKAHFYLNETGFLAISINQKELFNLQPILERIFNHDGKCFVGLFPVKIRHKDRQLMIKATVHDVYEYLLIYRKNKSSRLHVGYKKQKVGDYVWGIKTLSKKPKIEEINKKRAEIYDEGEYEIVKMKPNKDNFRRYLISGKIATANWSGEFYETHLKKLGNNKLIKIHGLENHGNKFRWFETSDGKRKSGVYFQSFGAGGRPILLSNDQFNYTDKMTYIYKEGGEGVDFKDSKKPEEMIKTLIQVTTKKGDLVMDLFGGSGTTIASAIKTGRSCLTIEKEPKNVQIIKKRLENLQKGLDSDGRKYPFEFKIR